MADTITVEDMKRIVVSTLIEYDMYLTEDPNITVEDNMRSVQLFLDNTDYGKMFHVEMSNYKTKYHDS